MFFVFMYYLLLDKNSVICFLDLKRWKVVIFNILIDVYVYYDIS